MKSLYERMGGTYTLGSDGIYYPDLTLPEEENADYGKYALMRESYLREHRHGLYTSLLLQGKLNAHLTEVERTATERVELLIRQMSERQHINESLKQCDQMAWVGAMNNIRHAAEEIVLAEIVYR